MHPIIVAVDFSNTAIHAVEYAISMANKMKSDIHLIWVDKLNPQESVYPDTSNENRNEAKKRFEELLNIYSKKLALKNQLLTHDKDKAVLVRLKIDNLIETNFLTIEPDASLGDLVKVVAQSPRNVFPVVDANNYFFGVIHVLLDSGDCFQDGSSFV